MERRARMLLDEDRMPHPRRVRVRLDDGAAPPVTLHATLIPTVGDVIALLDVAGTRFRQGALARLACQRPRAGFPCILLPEPANPHDPHAIGVWTRTGRVGYIPRRINRRVLGPLAALEAEHGTLIAVAGELHPAEYGLHLMIETPRGLVDDEAPR